MQENNIIKGYNYDLLLESFNKFQKYDYTFEEFLKEDFSLRLNNTFCIRFDIHRFKNFLVKTQTEREFLKGKEYTKKLETPICIEFKVVNNKLQSRIFLPAYSTFIHSPNEDKTDMHVVDMFNNFSDFWSYLLDIWSKNLVLDSTTKEEYEENIKNQIKNWNEFLEKFISFNKYNFAWFDSESMFFAINYKDLYTFVWEWEKILEELEDFFNKKQYDKKINPEAFIVFEIILNFLFNIWRITELISDEDIIKFFGNSYITPISDILSVRKGKISREQILKKYWYTNTKLF